MIDSWPDDSLWWASGTLSPSILLKDKQAISKLYRQVTISGGTSASDLEVARDWEAEESHTNSDGAHFNLTSYSMDDLVWESLLQ